MSDGTMIYLSGPMTGLPEFNFPAFTAACEAIRAAGHEVLSPHELTEGTGQPWEYYIRRDIIAMLTYCNSIALLPGWDRSRGALLEYHVACSLNFTVYDFVNNTLVRRHL